MSEAGLEPAKPASLAQYLCQFGYTDMLVTLGGFEPCEYRIEGPASLPLLHRAKLVGVEGVEPSPRGPRPRILPLYDTPMMKQAVFLLSGGPKKTTCFKRESLRLNRPVFGDLKGS